MLHAAQATVVLLLLAVAASSCMPLTEDPPQPTIATNSSPLTEQFTPSLEPTVVTVIPDPVRKRASVKSFSFAERIEAGTFPIFAAVPGTEKVLLQQHSTGPFEFRVPRRTSGEALWVMVRCSEPSAVSVRMQNKNGATNVVYNIASCAAADAGGGTRDNSSTHGEVDVAPWVHVDLTLISTDLK